MISEDSDFEFSVRDMFPYIPDNCDVYVCSREQLYSKHARLYFFVDGNRIEHVNPSMKCHRTRDLCKALNFDDQTTVLWLLKFGEYAPKFYKQLLETLQPLCE